ncbi:MAG: hypothetical protein KJ709_07875 [Nanoarchaeota archaeon]|nr:hypothetical protein [Nanoarchaeota archaeon]
MPDFKKLVVDVFAPKPGERVTILTDGQPGQKELIREFVSAFKEQGFPPRMVTYPPTGGHSAALPKTGESDGNAIDLEKFIKGLGKNDIVLAITKYSASGTFFSRLSQGFRCATMPSAFLGMKAFHADYQLVAKKSYVLRDLLNRAEMARIEFSTGHKLTVDLRVHRAKADDGMCREPGRGINLPSGEAYIVPFEGKGSRTEGELPVGDKVYQVKENKITSFRDRAKANIAELGLGCNDKAGIIGNILQDEKAEGVHIAYGMSSHLGGKVTAKMFKGKAVHQDIVYAPGCPIHAKRLVLDEEVIIRDGKYTVFR